MDEEEIWIHCIQMVLVPKWTKFTSGKSLGMDESI